MEHDLKTRSAFPTNAIQQSPPGPCTGRYEDLLQLKQRGPPFGSIYHARVVDTSHTSTRLLFLKRF